MDQKLAEIYLLPRLLIPTRRGLPRSCAAAVPGRARRPSRVQSSRPDLRPHV